MKTLIKKILIGSIRQKIRYVLGRITKLYLSKKQYSELLFWDEFMGLCIKWYQGTSKELYGHAPPSEEAKVTSYGLKENAIRTYMTIAIPNKYPDNLKLPADYFEGKRILDIGCGPLPSAINFTGCEVYGLDDLIDEYAKLGYPMNGYSQRLTCLKAGAENIPVDDDFFDAVISVNAIDHVKDFPAVAREITRVLKPDGIIRLYIHYHEPTACEPWCLNDEMVLTHFGHLGVSKAAELTLGDIVPNSPRKDEIIIIWGNT